MKRPNETFQERLDNKELIGLASEFVYKVRKIAEANGRHENEIWKNWKQYSEDCENSDQGACFPEFCQWYKLKDVVSYQEVA